MNPSGSQHREPRGYTTGPRQLGREDTGGGFMQLCYWLGGSAEAEIESTEVPPPQRGQVHLGYKGQLQCPLVFSLRCVFSPEQDLISLPPFKPKVKTLYYLQPFHAQLQPGRRNISQDGASLRYMWSRQDWLQRMHLLHGTRLCRVLFLYWKPC
jgi:hypothetical protein